MPFQLNADLYTYTAGNNHTPNGILFHASPPLISEILRASPGFGQPSTAAGANQVYQQPTGVAWQALYDTSALFGPGSDAVGSNGTGRMEPQVPGSGGTAAAPPGGWTLMIGHAAFAPTTNAGCSGALLGAGGAASSQGGNQQSSIAAATHNMAYVVDLVSTSFPNIYTMGGRCADASAGTFALAFSTTYSGVGCRFFTLWVGTNAGSYPALTPVPNPSVSWPATAQMTSAYLNGINGPKGVCNFLSNRPLLRADTSTLTTAITASTVTNIPINAVTYDNYSGFSAGIYTVPVSGVYLVHARPNVAVSSAQLIVGVVVNGTTTVWGPASSYPGSDTSGGRPSFTSLLDLHVGDTVEMVTFSTTTGAIGTGSDTRLVMVWMSALAPSNGAWSWTPPDTGFRWQAGTPASQLPGLLAQHLTNDLSFLIQRPYLLTHQNTQQTAQPNGTFNIVTMDSVTGEIHGDAGDSYNGWVSGATNRYVAVQPGFYLVCAGYYEAPLASAAQCLAAIGYYISSGTGQGSPTPDQYQSQASSSANATALPGAEAIGIYYLDVGDYVQPQYQQQNGAATYSTSITAGHKSRFSMVWISE